MKDDEVKFVLNEQTLLYYRLHPIIACKDLLGIQLAWFQRIMLRAMWWKSYCLLVMGRGSSKTRMVATFSVLRAMLYPDTKIGCLGPGARQGSFIFNEIESIFNNSDFFKAAASSKISRAPIREFVKFYNNSFIESLPIGQHTGGSKIRGARYNILCLDEFAQFDPDILSLVIMPFLAIQKIGRPNKIIQSSSAFYKHNHLWERYKFFRKKIEIDRDPNYYLAEYDYRDLLLEPDFPFQPDMNVIEQQRETMTKIDFEMEWLGFFPDESDAYFSSYLIDHECTPKDIQVEIELSSFRQKKDKDGRLYGERINNNADYIMGVDIAKAPGQANFAIAIGRIESKICSLVNVISLNGGTYDQMVKLIRECTINYNIVRIQMDKGGGGEALKEQLAKPFYDRISETIYKPILDMDDEGTLNADGLRYLRLINFHGAKHSNLFTNLKAEMEHKRVKFPINHFRDPDGSKDLERSMLEIREIKKELIVTTSKPRGANLHFEVPSTFRMDRAVALTLVIDAMIEERLPEWKSKIPQELPVGSWV